MVLLEARDKRRLAAIILGDVVGYSHLMGLDEAGTLKALKAHRAELIDPALAAYNGRLVSTPGDGILVEFGSAVDAVSCAVAIQRAMVTRNAEVPADRRIVMRMGINLGDIIIDGDEIYGDGVNVAARLETLCRPGGICISRSVLEQIQDKLPFAFTDRGEQSLKNIARPVSVFDLSAEDIATLPEVALPAAPQPAGRQARVTPGTRLNDAYEIDRLIGSGGMGEIFRGHEIHTGEPVAIKLILPDMEQNEAVLGLFQREASALRHLHHEAIVQYYVFSLDPVVRRHYIAMEFVDGQPLSELLRSRRLSFDEVNVLRRRVASGLDAAHMRGIVHRDVSPDNIIVPDGAVARAKIIDFGIARSMQLAQTTIIGSGIAGKYSYMSPEQLGLAGGEVTPKSDIYSFGLVLAEALSGRPIDMGGTQAEVVDKRRRLPTLDGIDARLRPLIERMLQPIPGDRPNSMADVAAWEPGLTAPEASPPAGPATPPVAARRIARSKPAKPSGSFVGRVAVSVAAAALLWGAGLLAYNEWLVPPTPPPRPDVGPNLTPSLPNGGGGLAGPSGPGTERPKESPPPPKADPLAKIADYVQHYDGGGCFFLSLLRATDTSADIEGLAAAREPMETFNQKFIQAIGFEPNGEVRPVTRAQCPAVDFLSSLRRQSGLAPLLELKRSRVQTGQSQAGEIRRVGNRTISLLYVQDDGLVRDVSDRLVADNDAKVFDIPVTRSVGSGSYPQLLVVVASAQPLASMKGMPMAADQFFAKLTAESTAGGERLAAAAKQFFLRQ